MKFKIAHKNILKGLQKVQSIIERREIKPILSNVFFRAGDRGLELCATNLEISMKEVLEAEITEGGSALLDAKKTFEIIREMPPGEIFFRKKENEGMEISAGDIFFSVVGLNPQEFPEIDFSEKETFQEIEKRALKDMVEKTLYAASSDETRPNLNGVFFEKTTIKNQEGLRLVATDGHRLAMINKGIDQISTQGELKIEPLDKGVIFPKKGLLELKKLLEEDQETTSLLIFLADNNGIFKKDNTFLAIRTIDEEFPNYKQAIPEKTKTKAIINRQRLLNSLKRISVIAEERSKAISLSFSPETLGVFTLNPVFGEGKETIPIIYEGEKIKLGFNASYLIESLSAINTEEVVIKIKDKDSPTILSPAEEEEGYVCIIMPMEIKE